MHLKLLKPKQSLNKAYLKEKISRTDIELFKAQFSDLLSKINDKADEEHLKSLIADFLKFTWYKDSHQINPIGKNDLVIHVGKSPADPVGVILEVKSPSNKNEMLTANKPNAKAFHELVLYYLRERIDNNNNEIKYLVATNIYEWYAIDANEFDKKVYRNTAVKHLYELKKSDNKDNPWFYDELKKLLADADLTIDATCFDIRDYKKVIDNADKQDDKNLIALYKILSPVHLLKLPFANDSNTLQPKFYSELLHLIGLYEYKEGSKKLISRKKKGERNAGSLLENAIVNLERHDKISRLEKPSQYGETYSDRIYTVALELVITWINRILFLKLLEAQLINYHKGDRSYTFLDKDKIKDFDDLDKLFFGVLAKRSNERGEDVQKKFDKVPYLNSSLFEPTDLEHQTLFINNIENSIKLPVLSSTVLKNGKGKTLKGNLDTLDYLFAFLNAYDFSSEGAEEIQEDNKQLINASVLGLIFEKINGYKDGSFFTPGFITVYMCRETIRRAVVQKFNEIKGWELKEYADLYNQIQDKKEANTIINSLKICDPAVGSGHFLVSALNEMIAIKSDLQVLVDKDGRTLRDYGIVVENDELIITDTNGDIFEYNPKSKESQRIQETLFHEKQTIIEGCLFGVDINPNSVKICRLRLWIELLKNAYYKNNSTELETLPNIDINIKVGNSLISRFGLDADLKQALRGSKWNIGTYRLAVSSYKNATNKEEKRELVTLIDTIKGNFRTSILNNGKEYKDLSKLRGQLDKLIGSNEDLFGIKKSKKELELERRRLELSIEKQEILIDEIKNNKIYQNAFEWRFEFPEVLNDEGDFEGFDVLIGNPPYIKEYENRSAFKGLKGKEAYQGKMDIWYLFGDLAFSLLKPDCYVCYIATNNWVTNAGASNFRNIVINKTEIISLIDFGPYMIFENASVQTMIMIFKKDNSTNNYFFDARKLEGNKLIQEDVLKLLSKTENQNSIYISPNVNRANLLNNNFTFNSNINDALLNKIKAKHNFNLREKADKDLKLKSELGQGIVAPQDFINKKSAEILKDKFIVGQGVFVLNQTELDNSFFSLKEKEIIKPYFTSVQLHKYLGQPINTHWILYTKSDINKPDKKTKKIPLANYPHVKNHLDKFKDIITSDFGPYGLHRAREQHFFEGEKIMVLRKCPKEPLFTYTDFECYVAQTFFIIQSSRIDLKYLTDLLNSKLIAFWLRHKGKMQGINYQLDKEPLLEIPIYKPNDIELNAIVLLVNKILETKNQNLNTSGLENQIDKLVYQLYDLTSDEIKIIEEN